MTYDFSVLFKNEIVADVHINTDSNETAIKRYVSGPKQPFMCSRTTSIISTAFLNQDVLRMDVLTCIKSCQLMD